MSTYSVSLTSLRGNNKRTAIIVASCESDAMTVAKMMNNDYRAISATRLCAGSIAD